MKTKALSLLVFSLFTVVTSFVSAESVKVFLLAGHSNIAGTDRIDNLNAEWNVPQDDVWIWLDHNMDGIGDWATLEPGHGGPTHSTRPNDPEGITLGGDGHLKVGPELGLGRTLADEYPEHRVALIKQVRSGTIAEWSTENFGPPEDPEHPWSSLVQKSSDAFEALEGAGHSYEVEGLFWSLGGRDARNWNSNSEDPDELMVGREDALARSAVYGENLKNFIGGVREQFGANLPVVIGMNDHVAPEFQDRVFPGMTFVTKSQLEIAASDPLTTVFSNMGLSTADNIHFDAMSQVEQGMRFGNAYIDLISQSTPGDYNGDGFVNVIDIDLQSLAMDVPTPDLGVFDENADAMVDLADRNILVQNYANTFFGDSNFDGEFDTKDLVAVFQAGQYEDGVDGNSTWVTGDWNGDGDFGTNDLVLAFQDGGYEQGPRESVATVPEPTGTILGISGLLLLGLRNRRRQERSAEVAPELRYLSESRLL